MLKRKAYEYLLKWKKERRKPLLIYGQRQVGKTFIITEFAKENYNEYFYIDFSKDAEMRSIFEKYHTVDSIVLAIGAARSTKLKKGSLLIFDEVQDCEEALSSMKSFAIDGNYDVIATGSMLGIMLDHSNKGLPPLSPMGYAEPYMMYSLDFEEFLWSQGMPEESIEHVRDCIKAQKPMMDPVCEKFHELFRLFMILGGMPASINAFNSDKTTFINSGKEIDSIIAQIKRDINRYNDSKIDKIKTAECFDSIPEQLSQTNKKFHYSRIENTSKVKKAGETYRNNLLWIRDAGYGLFVYALKGISLPVRGQINRDVFKVYLSDTGILIRMYGDSAVAAIHNGDLKYNLGAIAENAVGESLVKCGYKPAYYQKRSGKGQMEIDFVIETFDGITVIEVKSGKGRDAPSINKVGEYFDVEKKIMLDEGNIETDEKGILHLPLFASAFIDSLDQRPDFLK